MWKLNFIILALISVTLNYAAFSFYFLGLNPEVWTQEARAMFCVTSGAALFMSFVFTSPDI